MNILFKLLLMIALLFIAISLAGIYGMLHNQISYTISSEYFSCFKFDQMNIPHEYRNRIGASMVGFLATWWMGIVIGIILIPLGLMIPSGNGYFFGMLRTFGVVCVTAFLTGIIALIIGMCIINTNNLPFFYFPECVQDKVRFSQAGTMHNFSYIGGLIGINTGVLWIIIERMRIRRRRNR